MKFFCNTKSLAKAAKSAARLIGSATVIRPILANILIETDDKVLRLTASNQALTFTTSLPAKIESQGATTISAKFLSEILASCTSQDTEFFREENGLITIQAGDSRFQLPSISATEYPQIDKVLVSGDLELNFSSSMDFLSSLEKVQVAIGSDELKAAYKSVCFEAKNGKLTVIATDSKRLAAIELPEKIEKKLSQEWLVPSNTLSLLSAFSTEQDINIRFYDNQVVFSQGHTQLIGRLYQDSFPNWRQVIPPVFKSSFTVSKSTLKNALAAVSPISKSEDFVTRLQFQDEKVTVSASSQGNGNAKIEIKADPNDAWSTGDDIEVGINSKFLSQVLLKMESERVHLEFVTPVLPGLIHGDQDKGFLFVLMPILLE